MELGLDEVVIRYQHDGIIMGNEMMKVKAIAIIEIHKKFVLYEGP